MFQIFCAWMHLLLYSSTVYKKTQLHWFCSLRAPSWIFFTRLNEVKLKHSARKIHSRAAWRPTQEYAGKGFTLFYALLYTFISRVIAVTFGSGVNETFREDGPGTVWPEGLFPPQSSHSNIPPLLCSIRPNVHHDSELEDK